MPEREEALCDELLAGNVPAFYRAFKPLTVGGGTRSVTIYVAPDYVPVGSDDDFVRIPLSPPAAQRVADAFGCSLPTRRLVDRVHAAAEIKLEPVALPPTPGSMLNGYCMRHHRLIERALPEGARRRLVAGHKKDIVLSNLLERHPDQAAVYGGHRADGTPIQALALTPYEGGQLDYGHGVRLVLSHARVGAQSRELASLLSSCDLSGLLSDEGPLSVTRVPGA